MGSENRRTSKLMTFRLTPEEHAAVVEAAEARGVGPTAWVRRLALHAAEQPLPPMTAKKDRLAKSVDTFVGAVNKIGNNANQLALKANAAGEIATAAAVDALVDELRALRAVVRATLEDVP
ncbi:hypothetical protein KHP60_21160 [Microvirga sp. 3-52]|uniref:plasmid mobilization protein n=1 Tax=Microvirga sp. 3-52 TaxID=2792425 RepID=UPI001AC18B05|nr:hypothetical protein [Microvirga sp. 3-52]MBO1907023.1 hypothetical protein [Microvirga sp. 3-52]MBS7454819.1 hypothetical protein [Microvirga sp. 3-52]